MARDVLVFSPMVRKVARRFAQVHNYDFDDLQQELWVKVLEVLPDFDEVDDEEVATLVGGILKNRAIDVARRCNTVKKYYDPVDFSDEFAVMDFGEMAKSELECQCNEMKEKVKLWSQTKDRWTKRLVGEMLCPSEDTLAKWDAMIKRHSVYGSYPHIPPCAYHEILGISKNKITKIVKSLRVYLQDLYGEDAKALLVRV